MKKLALLVSLALSACGDFSIRNIDNPPSCPYYDEWITPSISGRCPTAGQPRRLTPGQKQQVLEINKALLECGKPHYNPNRFTYELAGYKIFEEQLNNMFMATGCMQKAGFVSKSGGVSKSCQIHSNSKALPACQPDAVFPERSVERRLNSWYCKLYTDREYCHKYAFKPSACDRPEKNYNNPPPECLP